VQSSQPPIIVHIIHRLAVGGLENGLVNLINGIPEERYSHIIICMTNSTDFADRITNKSVKIIALDKKAGKDLAVFVRLWKTLRQIKPDIVHTRNTATIECVVPAFFSGGNVRIHGEHGRDILDLDGKNKKYLMLKRCLRLFISHYIALSKDLENWLVKDVHVKKNKITQIYNGVDTQKYKAEKLNKDFFPSGFYSADCVFVGTIGRMQGEKDQLNLTNAFITIHREHPEWRHALKLILVGDGPLKEKCEAALNEANLLGNAWLPGSRSDANIFYHAFDIFVLPSLIEGISNTILEAMASALPVVATNVGGNPELVVENQTGRLVPAADPQAMAEALVDYIADENLRHQHGENGLTHIRENHSMDNMVNNYLNVYDKALSKSL